MEKCQRMLRAVTLSVRQLHYKSHAKDYPQVHVDNVVVNKPRYGYRRVRPPLISQLVKDYVFPAPEIRKRYMEAGKPVPIKFRSHSDEKSRFQYLKFQEEIALGEPHFKVGLKQVYFPKARVCLLRPNAKHSPYQAKFLVPRNFNKMDLRDYLWNIYGLRALNVTVQLLHARYIRTGDEYARYRGPQYKKMTIDMQEPFIWPEVPQDIIDAAEYDFKNETETIKQQNSLGSDKLKPLEAFDGIFKKHVLPDAFISRNFKRKAEKNMNEYKKQQEMNAQRSLVASFINVKKDIENRV